MKRNDHVNDAMACLIAADGHLSAEMAAETGEYKADVIAVAQAHATLALVEQQRIANLQAERAILWRRHGMQGLDEQLAAYKVLDDEIRSALGLEESK